MKYNACKNMKWLRLCVPVLVVIFSDAVPSMVAFSLRRKTTLVQGLSSQHELMTFPEVFLHSNKYSQL